MAKIKQGILGAFSGKVAGVVGSSWKGIAVMKSLPASVANPKTSGQIAQRTKFSNAVAFAGEILSTVVKPLWDRFAGQMSGYNDFIRTNISLFTAALPSPAADLVISKGKMANTAIATAASSEATSELTVTWTDDSGEGFKTATDEAYIVVVDEDQSLVYGFATGVVRSAETLTVETAIEFSEGDTCHVYLAFSRADGTVVSNTSYKTFTAGA